jgi:hypothetical protein
LDADVFIDEVLLDNLKALALRVLIIQTFR